jgi:hypothetical protein
VSRQETEEQGAGNVEKLSIRVSWELFNRVFDYCAESGVGPDDLVAEALRLGLASPEKVGAESWREEPFASLVPVELVDELTDLCDENGWDRQSFLEMALRRLVEPRPAGAGFGKWSARRRRRRRSR